MILRKRCRVFLNLLGIIGILGAMTLLTLPFVGFIRATDRITNYDDYSILGWVGDLLIGLLALVAACAWPVIGIFCCINNICDDISCDCSCCYSVCFTDEGQTRNSGNQATDRGRSTRTGDENSAITQNNRNENQYVELQTRANPADAPTCASLINEENVYAIIA